MTLKEDIDKLTFNEDITDKIFYMIQKRINQEGCKTIDEVMELLQ